MMKHLAWIAAGVMLAIVARFISAEDELRGPAKKLPPLKVDKAAPLLLKEAPPRTEPVDPAKPRADNGACFVCHGNFQDETMVAVHAKENIGCIKCHGSSAAHRNDEDNVTAPDKMFAAARIDKSCGECHEGHDAPVRKVVRMFQERFPPNTDPKKVVCTDCHGEHRLNVRSVRWDKNTGKLLAHDPEAAKRTGVERKKVEGAK
jgi:hypothetical protein